MIFKKIKHFIFIFVLVFSYSCGKSTEQTINDALISSEILLTKRDCQASIDLLEAIGRQTKNARYLKNLASAYACRAGYSTVTFFGTDIAKTAAPTPLGGTTLYTTSVVTSPLTNDTNFRDLQTAIDILLYAGGIPTTTSPSVSERAKYFSTNVAGDINTQLTFMIMAQIGKVLTAYGNPNALGVKGAGAGTNDCFTDYSDAGIDGDVKTYLTLGLTGSCVSAATASNAQLGTGVADRRKRLCEGAILLNNFFEVLPIVIATAGGGDVSSIAFLVDEIDDLKAELVLRDPTMGPTTVVLSQTKCETDTDISNNSLASYYAVFYESLFQ